jgi:hypothetical protein
VSNEYRLPDAYLWQCLDEADQRRADKSLPLEVRVRSAETYALCLLEAQNRGYDYAGLRTAASKANAPD